MTKAPLKHRKGSTLGEFFFQRQEPGRAGLPTMSVTMNDNLVLRDDLDRRTESALTPEQHLLVRKGDIAYNMMRMWQGACGLATADGIVSPAYVVLAPKHGIDSRFAYHWFKTDRMVHLFWAYSHGLTEDRLRLYFDDFAEIPASPPSIGQQQSIVAVLDAWDRAMLIAEKATSARRRRFWEVFRRTFSRPLASTRAHGCLGDLIASISAGVSVNSEDRPCRSGEVGVLKTSSVLTGKFRPEEHKAVIATDISRVTEPVSADSILVSRMNTPDLVGASAYVGSSVPSLFLPDRIWQIRVRRNVSARWLGFVLGSPAMRIKLKSIATGTSNSMKNIAQDSFLSLKTIIPPFDEQKRIAEALDLLEQDLAHSERRSAILRSQKRSLMQKFLADEWMQQRSIESVVLAPTLARMGAT